MRLYVEVPDGNTVAEKVITALRSAGMLTYHEESSPPPEFLPRTVICPCCGDAFDPARAVAHPELGEGICPPCQAAAKRIEQRFSEDLAKHVREFRGQLRQLVIDVRGGADVPVFYRGFE